MKQKPRFGKSSLAKLATMSLTIFLMNILSISATRMTEKSTPTINLIKSDNYPPNVDVCWAQTPTDGESLTLNFTVWKVKIDNFTPESYQLWYTSWVTVSPSINGKTKFWGSNVPPTHTFPINEVVIVCLTGTCSSDIHRGFTAQFSDSSSTLPAPFPGFTSVHNCNNSNHIIKLK